MAHAKRWLRWKPCPVALQLEVGSTWHCRRRTRRRWAWTWLRAGSTTRRGPSTSTAARYARSRGAQRMGPSASTLVRRQTLLVLRDTAVALYPPAPLPRVVPHD